MAAGRMVAERSETLVPSRRLDFKTKLLTAVVVLANVLGNFSLSWDEAPAGQTSGFAAGLHPNHLQPVGAARDIASHFVAARAHDLLSWADLSYVLPVTSIGYVFTAFLGKYFFYEQITWQRWLGTLAITIGMILVGLTTPNTTACASEVRR